MRTKQLDLNEREFGAWFAPFEKKLIFDQKDAHIGWVVPINNNTFKLQESPFYQRCRNYSYIVSDENLMPPQNVCIEVEVGKIDKKIKFDPKKKSLMGDHDNYCHVENYKKYKRLTS